MSEEKGIKDIIDEAGLDWEIVRQFVDLHPGSMTVILDYLFEDEILDKNLFFPRNMPEDYENPLHNILPEWYEKELQRRIRMVIGKREKPPA